MIFIGTAGWSIPKAHTEKFPEKGTHLERYAHCLHGVEVNSSFYRVHQEATYYRWSYTTPPNFRFSVKFPRLYTHEHQLVCTPEQAKNVVEPMMGLREKLAVLLVQLPPKLPFERDRADSFFSSIRSIYSGQIAFEPRHPSWGRDEAFGVYKEWRLTKVEADPEPCPAPLRFAEAGGFRYHRLHGSPEIYRSAYSEDFLERLHRSLQEQNGAWCIFDNTTFGHATANALDLQARFSRRDEQVA